jgi:O-methyltransferase
MTNTEKSQLSGVKETLLYTLYYRALDQRSKAPIVGDTWAADVLDRITADNRKGLLTAKLGRPAASRRFCGPGGWTTGPGSFLPATPTRPCCTSAAGWIAAPSGSTYRREFGGMTWTSPTSSNSVAASTPNMPDTGCSPPRPPTPAGWTRSQSTDPPSWSPRACCPTSPAADVRQLFVRLTDRLPSGELIFDGVAGPTARMSKLFQWSLGDPWEIERWNPRLALIDVVPVVADFERIPYRRYRALFQLMNKIQAIRNGMRLLRYRF